ncbi:hypothetical protein DOK67_0000413 [Enterococcus sp. DIV0212c]|uniref:hypothetical protein n=1 Tax=Enterococcus sp. DIV0212c TaxID=2230867 RepID=UPI001A9BE173|nr:hypothetical protein [Enterococcus sp. DIV0212c]MBO1352965.1 hypothetical protein [Enterococcus sp. DIV0212c]
MKNIWIVGLLFLFLVGCSEEKPKETKDSSNIQSSQSTQKKKVYEKSSSVASQSNENPHLDQNSNSGMINDSSQSMTINNSEVSENTNSEVRDNANAATPVPIRGAWVGNNGEVDIEVTITENTIISNGQTYTVTGFTQSGNTYTILWDVDSVANPGNPQPFIYTYSPETDELSAGIVLKRK